MVTRHLPEELSGLEKLCHNLWWCWNDEAKALFKSVDKDIWHKSGHNPMEILDKVSLKRYMELAKDKEFLARLGKVMDEFNAYMEKKNERTEPSIGYFCMEYGLDTSLKIYSGGLGILAGDYLKETSDMNVNLVGVGLFYRYGYFTQRLTPQGNQVAEYQAQDFIKTPAEPVQDENGVWKTIKVALPGREMSARIWKVAVGRTDLYLLDTDYEDNIPEDVYFYGASYGYNLVTDVDGLYAKFGFIVRPLPALRLGAAIQTPGRLTVSEMWQYTAGSSFSDGDFSASSPMGEYSYGLRTPYVLDLGAAVVLGQFGLLSVDYGFSDFGVMRFFDIHPDSFEDPFYDLNETNRLFAGVSHNLRAGLEARLTRHFSARAGLSFLRRSERCWTNSQGNMVYADQFINDFYDYYENHLVELVSRSNVNSDTFSYSFGLGYSSDRSFFADFAVRFTNYPDSWFSPYYDYDNFDAAGNTVNAASPVLTNYRKAVNMALTLGWRF